VTRLNLKLQLISIDQGLGRAADRRKDLHPKSSQVTSIKIGQERLSELTLAPEQAENYHFYLVHCKNWDLLDALANH
jgi:hypothetical protein